MNYRLLRTSDASLIPKKLVRENKDRTYSLERFYEYMKIYLLDSEGNYNDCELLYLVLDGDNNIIGYLWYSLNILESEIFINTISIDKDHRNNGSVLKWVFETLRDTFIKTEYEYVKTISSRQGWHKNNGFEESKNVLLEYKLHKEG